MTRGARICWTMTVLLALQVASSAWAVGPLHYRYDMQWGATGTGDSQFNQPHKVNVRGTKVIVADKGNNRVQVFDLNGNFLSKYGTAGSGQDNLMLPYEAEFDSLDRVYIADSNNYRVMRRSAALAYLTQWGTNGSGAAQFNLPVGLAVDRVNGWVYVADRLNHRISKWTIAGGHLLNFGSNGSGNGQLSNPYDVYVGAGCVYVADTGNSRVQKFDSAGGYLAQWNGSAGGGTFTYPYALTVGADGSVFVADTFHHLIKKYTASGGYLTAFGGPGTSNGVLQYPSGVAVDDSGRVYVSDTDNDRIQRFRLNNRPTTPSSLSITPSPRYDNDDLAAHASGSTDADGDILSYRYVWYKSPTNAAPWTKVKEVRILPASYTQPNVWYRFQVHVWDGYDYSAWATSSSILIHAAPTTPAMSATAQQTAQGAVAVTVTLAAAANVSGDLANLAGRTVSNLTAQALPAGTSTIVVQALSSTGTRLPAGQYLLKLKAAAADGNAASTLVPVSLR